MTSHSRRAGQGAHLPRRQHRAASSPTTSPPCWSPASVVVAMVPLVWVLYTVITKGIAAVTSSDLVDQLAGRHDCLRSRRRRLPRDHRHPAPGPGLRDHLDPDRHVRGAIYLVEYGGGTRLGKLTTFMVDILTGVPSIVAALFIYALWIATLGFPRSALRGVAGVGAADDSGRRAHHRGDAAHRARWICARRVRAGRAEVEDDRRAIVIPTALSGHRHRHHAGAGPRHG